MERDVARRHTHTHTKTSYGSTVKCFAVKLRHQAGNHLVQRNRRKEENEACELSYWSARCHEGVGRHQLGHGCAAGGRVRQEVGGRWKRWDLPQVRLGAASRFLVRALVCQVVWKRCWTYKMWRAVWKCLHNGLILILYIERCYILTNCDSPKPSWESEWGRKTAELELALGWNQIWTSCRLLKTHRHTHGDKYRVVHVWSHFQ